MCGFLKIAKLISLSVLAGLLFSAAAFAGRLPVKIYTSADGLGSGFVEYLMRDSRGFMWFCTRNGLSRFDGSRFVTYQLGETDPTPGIEAIFESRDGVYWITTVVGTFRFDPKEGGEPDPVTHRMKAKLVGSARGFFWENSQGDLFMVSNELFRAKFEDEKLLLERVDLNITGHPGTGFVITDLAEASDGSLWLNTSWGLVRRLPDGRSVYYPFDPSLGAGSLAMIADKTGRIWLALGNELYVIKPDSAESLAGSGQQTNRKIEANARFELKPGEGYSLPKVGGEIFQYSNHDVVEFVENTYGKRIFQTSDGNVWITAESYLLQFSDGIFQLHSGAEGLPNVMTRMAEDAAGNLWLGGHSGLTRLDRQGMVTYGPTDGASSTRFFAVNEESDGTLYFAARDFYINRFDGKKIQAIRPAVEPGSQFLWTSRFAYRQSTGDWWILTSSKLYRFFGITDLAQLNGRRPSATYSEKEGLPSNGIFQIFEDSSGDIWVSTRHLGGGGVEGLARLKKGESRFQTFGESAGYPRGRSAAAFAQDRLGNIWLAFYEGGLARFDGDRFETFGRDDGLPVGTLTDLHIDAKGRLWIGSAVSGLLRLDDVSSPKPAFTRLTIGDGLTSNNIRTITEDRFGRIYVGTASGVDRITPDTGRVKHYSVSDGLGGDFVVDSHCDRNGDLWFATSGGMSRLVPKPDEKSRAPQIFLGGVRIAGTDQNISELGAATFEKGELSHNENNLQIDFFGLDLHAGETMRYQFKLEPADADWSPPTDLRNVTYGNLQPADYRFLVRAVNSDGVVSETPAVVTFRILPPIWERWWFLTLAVLLLAVIAVGFYLYRTEQLRKINTALREAKLAETDLRLAREERLAELESVRSRIATDLHDDIGASLTQIAVLSEVAQAQSHNGNGALHEPLDRITQVSNELIGTMSDIVWSINPAKDHVSDLTQRMRRFAADVLTSRGIKFHFADRADWAETVVGSNLRREAFLIFKESINNIVKHAGSRNVWAEVTVEGRKLILEIRDDGEGFDTAAAEKNGSGNGLASMRRRSLEIGGKFSIDSRPGTGTTIRVIFPVENLSATFS